MVVVGFVIVNGYLFQKIVHPAIRKVDFTDTNDNHKYVKIRKLSFAFGAVSITSWMTAFILGSISRIPVTFFTGLLLYIIACICAVIVSQLVEYKITHNK
jgi:hypothetical protein